VPVGEEQGQVSMPFDLAVLPDGRFVVADLPYGRPPEVRLQLFAADGRLLAVLLEDTADLSASMRTWFESLLARRDRTAATLYEKARVHHYHGGYDRRHLETARDLYLEALAADPRHLLARLGLAALLHTGLKDAEAAEAHYRAAMEAGGAEGDMLARMAECRHDRGDLDGAILLLRRAVESPRPPEGYHDLVEELGDYYIERG
jgi:tetratricopeptide (TPR) repeat protein